MWAKTNLKTSFTTGFLGYLSTKRGEIHVQAVKWCGLKSLGEKVKVADKKWLRWC